MNTITWEKYGVQHQSYIMCKHGEFALLDQYELGTVGSGIMFGPQTYWQDYLRRLRANPNVASMIDYFPLPCNWILVPA